VERQVTVQIRSNMSGDELPVMAVIPQVSINGTDIQSLIAQQQDVLLALHELTAMMKNACPHGRDYQYDSDFYDKARALYVMEADAIETIRARHGAILEALLEASWTNNRNRI